jgi:hypothetical protein
MSIATTADLEIAPTRPLLIPLVSAACVALADWLFYGWEIGISLALFLGVLGVVAVASHRERAARKIQIIMAAIFVAGLLALVENVNELSVIVGTLATAMFVYVLTAHEATSWQRNLFEAATIPFRGPFQLIGDLIGTLRHMKMWTPEWLGSLVAWIVPLSVFAVFLALFSSANPLIENRLLKINFQALFNLLEPRRIWFWTMVACAIWPLLRRRIGRKQALEPEPRATPAARLSRCGLSSWRAGCDAFADPVQRAVRAARRSRSDLSLGWRESPRRHEPRRIRPSRRLSADRNRAARRRLCPDRDAPGRTC